MKRLFSLIIIISIVDMTVVVAQSDVDNNLINSFTEWCQQQGSAAENSATIELLRNDKCSCSYYNSDAGITEGFSIEAVLSRDKLKIEDAATLLGAKSIEIEGSLAMTASFYYDILGQAISTISWTQNNNHFSIKFTQNYPPGYVREEAPAKAEVKVSALASSLIRKLTGKGNTGKTGKVDQTNTESNRNQTEDESSKPKIPKSDTELEKPADDNKPMKPGDRNVTKPTIKVPENPGYKNPEIKKQGAFGVHFGLIGGVSMNGFIYDFSSGSELNNASMIGYTGGILVELDFGGTFSIQLPVTWKVKGDEAEASLIYDFEHQYFGFEDAAFAEGTIDHELQYIELPIVANFNFALGANYLSLGAGPYVAKGLTGKELNNYDLTYYAGGFPDYTVSIIQDRSVEFKDVDFSGDETTKYLRSWDYGIYGQLAYRANQFMLGVSISYGLADISNQDDWTSEYGVLIIPEVKTLSTGLFLAYLLK